MEPERRALVVLAELEAAEPPDRLLGLVEPMSGRISPPSSTTRAIAASMSSTAKKSRAHRRHRWGASRPHVRRAQDPPVAGRPGLEPPPEQALVERPSCRGFADPQFEEADRSVRCAHGPQPTTENGRDLGQMGGVKISTFEHWRIDRRIGTLPRHGDASVDRDRPVQDDRQVPRARGGDAGLRGTAAVSPADAERPGPARGLCDLLAGRRADRRLLPALLGPRTGRRRAANG